MNDSPEEAADEWRHLGDRIHLRCRPCVPSLCQPVEPLPLLMLRHLLAVHVDSPLSPVTMGSVQIYTRNESEEDELRTSLFCRRHKSSSLMTGPAEEALA